MWRRLAPLVFLLFSASSAFGFNSNMPGGSISGGTCAGGTFMTGITAGGAPICGTPSGGAPYPPGAPAQVGGYSAVNTGEAETVVGDFTYARTGANQYTATVTQINHITPGGVCSAGTFASTISSSGVPTCTAPPAPAAGSITDAMLTGAYSGVGACTAGSVATTLNRNAAPTCSTIASLGSGTFAPLTNPAGGQNGYASTSNPTFTGTVTFPAGAIADAALANAYSGIGACTGGQFVSTLNRNAAPTCTSPPAGFTAGGDLSGTNTTQTVIGIRSTSVPVLASGYLHYNGTAFVWDTPGGGFAAGGDLSGTASSQTVIGIRNTSVPVLASGYLQYTGSAFAWSTPAVGAPATNPPGGASNYAAIASPTFTGAVTAPTLNLTGTAPALTFNGTAMGGSCGTGAFVNVISNAGVPTCGVNLASLYAPLTNPAGGQNGYASTANPSFTGVMSFPDGSTYTSAGHQSMKALGVGVASPTGLTNAPNSVVINGSASTGGATIPSDTSGGTLFNTYVTYVQQGTNAPAQGVDAGVYYAGPPTSNYKVADTNGNLIHAVANPDGHEMGWFLSNGNTNGAAWSTARSQYLALRDNLAGSGAGLFLESGQLDVMGGGGHGLVVGGPTSGDLGTGSVNAATKYYINGNPLTQVVTGTIATMGSASTFTISSSHYECMMVFDGAAANGHAVVTCDITLQWSAVTGQNGSVVNIGYMPWNAATGAPSYFSVTQMSGITVTAGCVLGGNIGAGTSWLAIGGWGSQTTCGSGYWVPDTSFAASGGIALHGTYRAQ